MVDMLLGDGDGFFIVVSLDFFGLDFILMLLI